MASRMDKYRTNSTVQSRFQKNERLYEEVYTNKVFTKFTGIENDNAIEVNLSSSNLSSNKRENFHRNKNFYSNDTISPKSSFLEKKSLFEEDPTQKNYNINDILEEARKRKMNNENQDSKRNLKMVEYSILSDLSHEKIKDYKENKQKLSKDEEENLEELIHTITSNSLRKKIDDELLEDLLPSQESETIISGDILDQIEEESKKNTSLENTENTYMDHSFYTKSMDLSEEDFDFEDDISFLEDDKPSILKRVFVVLLVLVVLAVLGYIMYRFII